MKHRRTRVFVSYSHRDEQWLERLQVHLVPLSRVYRIEIWDDSKIAPGAKWQTEIQDALDSTLAAVLLVSADFLASDFIVANELPPLLKAAEEEGAVILPVILSPCWFKNTPGLAQFQAVNNPADPLINGTRGEQEAVFVRVAECIEKAYTSRAMESELQHIHDRVDDAVAKIAQLFLLTMSGPMYENLHKLAQDGGFGAYSWSAGLERELYHLRDIGYIDVPSVRSIPRSGANLSEHVVLTTTGRQFLELRNAMERVHAPEGGPRPHR
jgi:hypothetical protein